MTTPDRVSDLFHQALKRPPEDRAAFLEQACNGDDVLLAEVESLLAYDARSFLEAPAAVVSDAPLMTGRRVGSYVIGESLGAGGMGQVYRARDSKLGRDVAIKVLPPHFTADPERRARFAREARVLATLTHPHIGAIYGLEESGGVTALVLELIEGVTLADRLVRGPLPIPEALAIARQIAEALDAAHQKGIIHRDLKPANVVLQPVGGPASSDVRVKVLDFGLAKSINQDGETVSLDSTAEGRVLGTPAYMSPEQARGLPVDKRTDVWAFGCVLYEMLTGQPAFAGATVTDTLARILDQEPDWTRLPAETPPAISAVLARCLRKDTNRRLHDIADAQIEIDDARSQQSPVPGPGSALQGQDRHPERLAWIVAAGLGAALLALIVLQGRRPGSVADPLEFTIDPPENWRLTTDATAGAANYAVSPDGQQLVLVAYSGGTSALWVRPISKPAWKQLAATDGADAPFWSADNRSIGFIANDQLKKVSISGGPPVALARDTSSYSSGGSWNRSGVILFVSRDGLYKISSGGGTPTPVTTLETDETGHRWPSFLPDDNHFLYLVQRRGSDELRIGSLTSPGSESLGLVESNAVYANGRLLVVRGGALTAQSFDTTTWKLTGEPTVVANQAAVLPPLQRGLFSVSATGVLAYSRAGRPISQLTWIDRKGSTVGATGEPGFYINLDLSPDGARLAASRLTETPGGQATVDIWILDLARVGTGKRLTGDEGREFDPAWSPDGNYLAFNSDRERQRFGLYVRRSDASGQDELWRQSDSGITGPTWSRDGGLLMFADGTPTTHRNLWIMPTGCDNTGCKPVNGGRKPTVLLPKNYDDTQGSFSPDGHWIAYQSNETGQDEVYVRPFPSGEARRISVKGGRAARWRRDGRELFYLTPNGLLMVVRISTTPRFTASVPEPLFQTGLTAADTNHPYVVANDGQRFLIPIPRETWGTMPITVVLHWPETIVK